MSLLDTLVSRLGRPAGRALDPTIRDVVQAVLKEQGYASPAEVQSLRDEVRDMRTRVDGMQARLDAVVAKAEAARATPTVDVAPLEARIAELQAQVAAGAARIAELEARPASAPAPAAAPAPLHAEVPAGCKVPGCTGAVRSKAFCSAHYQQWRRGTLEGFVGLDGHVSVGGTTARLDAGLAGAAVELRGGKVVLVG